MHRSRRRYLRPPVRGEKKRKDTRSMLKGGANWKTLDEGPGPLRVWKDLGKREELKTKVKKTTLIIAKDHAPPRYHQEERFS